jgi:hypothetical protein
VYKRQAWTYNKPLIYSSLYTEQVDNAAIYVDPFNPESIADGILMSSNADKIFEIVENGKKRISFFELEKKNSQKNLEIFILKYSCLKENWQ